MKPIQLLVIALMLSANLLAQTPPIPDGANSITIAELRDHMYYLASDELEGRKPGTPGYEKAAEYAVSQFRQVGITPLLKTKEGGLTYLQAISFEKQLWNDTNTISIEKNKTTETFSIHQNFIILEGKPFAQKEITGDLAYIGAGIHEPEYGIDNYKDVAVKGKWVVMHSTVPDTLRNILPQNIFNKYNTIKRRAGYAREMGSIGIIVILSAKQLKYWTIISNDNDFKERNFIKDAGSSSNDDGKTVLIVDSLIVSHLFEGSGYNPINDDMNLNSFSLGKTNLKLTKNITLSEFESYNIIGIVEGTDPILKDEFITVGGHLDHVGFGNKEIINGADDNASGSVGVIEIAEAIAKTKPKRSVLFMLYTAEEMGLLGSKFIIENPPVPLDKIKVNINLDMIGRSDGDVQHGIAPMSVDTMDVRLKSNIISAHQKYPFVELDWAYADTSLFRAGSDHYCFHQKKIPSVFFFSGIHPDYHQPGDDAHKIDYEFFQKNCQFVYHLVMELANSENLSLTQHEVNPVSNKTVHK